MIKNSLRLCPGLCSVPVLVSALVFALVSATSVSHHPNMLPDYAGDDEEVRRERSRLELKSALVTSQSMASIRASSSSA